MTDQDQNNPLLRLNVWSPGNQRALNKPLLVLLALGRLSRGERALRFVEIENELNRLLREFGNQVRKPRAEYSFWRLKNDRIGSTHSKDEKIWSVSPEGFTPNSKGDVYAKALRERDAVGRFTDGVLEWLLSDKKILSTATQQFLDGYFAESLHEELLSAVGFTQSEDQSCRRRRDPAFRRAVLDAYQMRCAVCLQDIRIGSETVGLEAAHIKWHQAGGSDEVANGLSLCSLHHKLFDLGTFTVGENLNILVSEHMTGTDQLDAVLLRFHLQNIRTPTRKEYLPAKVNLIWHREKIFKERPIEK